MNRILERIQLKGFKTFREISVDLKPLNVLIGPNGVGKSNFIGLFRLLNQIVERNLQLHVAQSGGADALLHFGRKQTPEIEISLAFGLNGYKCVLVPTEEGGLVFKSETVWFELGTHQNPCEEYLGSGQKETNLFKKEKDPASKVARDVARNLWSWRVYHFHDTSSEAKVKQFCDVHDNAVLRGDASNLAAFLFKLREVNGNHYRIIVDAVRMMAPFFDDFVLRPSELNKEKIRLDWKEKGSDSYFGPSALSDGTLRFICLGTLLLQPSLPLTVLLDEPELGLHPYAISLLSELLRGASTKTQVIASTQSVSLVNQFEPADVIVAEREAGQSVFRRMDEVPMRDWLDDYGVGDLWEKNLIGGRP